MDYPPTPYSAEQTLDSATPLQAKSSLESQEGKTETPSFTLGRLLEEEPGVEGACWFAKYREDPAHVAANILRVLVLLLISPIYFLVLEIILMKKATRSLIRDAWWYEGELTHSAVLRYPPGKPGKSGEYEATNFRPQWLMQVEVRNGTLHSWQQIRYEEAVNTMEFQNQGYTALSYSMDSAFELLNWAQEQLLDGEFPDGRGPGKRRFTLEDRRKIAAKYLQEYYCAERSAALSLDRTEFVWLDEFCLADFRQLELVGDEERKKVLERSQRSMELGRLADIFGGASKVCIFCHDPGCEHTGPGCCWGKRLFTLPEILHAKEVEVMRMRKKRVNSSYIVPMSAIAFRQQMLHTAARFGKWHLYAIMQSTINSGSVPWQTAIQALIVEAIHRDNEGDFKDHKFLGKGLNGLLPRRAKLADLKGENGWADLAWLLELNQGFYNAASLAAVCTLGSVPSWIGPPIEPAVGNERLDPLAIAYPVGRFQSGGGVPPLNIVGAETIRLHRSLKRDGFALYRQKDWKVVAICTRLVGAFGIVLGFTVAGATGPEGLPAKMALLPYCLPLLAMCVQLYVGTMYLEENWAFIENVSVQEARAMLEKNDAKLRSQGGAESWGEEQLAPEWHSERHDMKLGAVVDVKTGIITQVAVTAKPNAVVVLAFHGNGVTSMLLDRPVDSPTKVGIKVGMCNLPPYTLYSTEKAGSVTVGG